MHLFDNPCEAPSAAPVSSPAAMPSPESCPAVKGGRVGEVDGGMAMGGASTGPGAAGAAQPVPVSAGVPAPTPAPGRASSPGDGCISTGVQGSDITSGGSEARPAACMSWCSSRARGWWELGRTGAMAVVGSDRAASGAANGLQGCAHNAGTAPGLTAYCRAVGSGGWSGRRAGCFGRGAAAGAARHAPEG